MNFHRRSVGAACFIALWFCAAFSALAQPKVIQLRNERIETPPPNRQALLFAAQDEPRVSGLFLIQFDNPVQSNSRVELSALGAELVSYIPDDAYVARLTDARLGEIRALPEVRWVGEYRPEHKVFSSLDRWSRNQQNLAQAADITVLLSPAATAAEVAEARARLQRVQQESRSRIGSVLRGRLAANQLRALAQSPGVLWIEPAPKFKLNDEISSELVAGEGSGSLIGMQELGFDGSGVTIAVADSGLHIGESDGMHIDLAGRTPAFFFYGNLTDASDEHAHGTHVSGIIAGNGATTATDEQGYLYGLGVAPGASIITQRIFDGVGQYEAPPSFAVLTGDAVQAGAEIGSNSWGDDTQGRYDVSAAEFDALVRDAVSDQDMAGDQPYILEFSAGNSGPGAQTIGSPAVAKNVIATGASQNNRFEFFIYDEGQETMADFSSRGPAEDGRIKPDVVAPGTWIASLRSPVGNDENAWTDIDFDYLYMGGTSQAGPQVSGAAAVFVQYYRDTYGIGTPSPALVKAALIHSAVDMDDSGGTTPTPNMDEGWGRVDLTEIIGTTRWHDYLDQTSLLSQGQTYERSVIISSSAEPLRITLVYTDVPGFPGAIPALVNNLDLEVIGPDGRTYHGNQFNNGESIPDTAATDSINNIEGFYLSEPAPGEYMVRVRAKSVAQDARRDTAFVDQDFALVVSGSIPPPETGSILLDRTHYTAPSRIRVKLFDLDLAGVPSVNVRLRSATETNGQSLTLIPFNASGVFTGSVATATGAAIPNDNRLQIAHGDWIRAEYFDASEQVTNFASATADLIPPVISNVIVTNAFGQMVITWQTDEPASGVVRFGTNATLNRAETNNFLLTSHAIALDSLVAGATYFFSVTTADRAGNLRTNNSGASFVALPASTVLLVDAYVHNVEDTLIPQSSYTDALDQTGVTYDVWNVSTRGQPVFASLRPYQVVIWRINDSFNSTDTIPSAQRNAIQQYVNSGGGFMLASMESLSRLLQAGAGSFITNVLHVNRFDRNDDPLSHCLDCDEDFQVPYAAGVSNDVVGDGLLLSLNYTAYPSFEFFGLGPDFADTFGVATNATAMLLEQTSSKPCGMRYPRTGQDSTGRVVFVSFPLDAIPLNDPAPNNRAGFLRRAIQFLAPGVDGLGTISISQDFYRLPDLITIDVGDTDLVSQTNATVLAYSTSFPTPISIPLQPTARASLFRATLPLIPVAAGTQNGKLRANPGDTITVEYFDASGGITIRATAIVDTLPPIITGLDVVPDYGDATITWSTSEPTDALVQYGESAFLGRTAYINAPGTSHEVLLRNLAPDRLYYYKIASRDAAGNFTEDDNNGELHTFRTLRPLALPFIERLHFGGTNWTVFNGEETQFEWKVGLPQNGHIANTPSMDALAWGSNLRGASADTIDTFLISPALDLTGGNVARLRFVHAYDFHERTGLDLFEGGELLIITNSYSAPVALATYSDTSTGWENEEFDLTPYIGNVIFLVWHHQLLAFEAAERPGWALDDIVVTITNIAPGTISVSNNLAQARVTLAGPTTRSAMGVATNFHGLPPGRYTAAWNAVQDYISPPRQTNDLESGGLLEITGLYTFADANNNGMSDTWEQRFFGNISPTRTCVSDTDNDGFPDCAEFRAGTDPTRANSFLRLNPPTLQPGYKLLFQWPAVPGRIYQVQGTRDGENWVPMANWIQPTTGNGSVLTFVPDDSEPFLFRVEVRP